MVVATEFSREHLADLLIISTIRKGFRKKWAIWDQEKTAAPLGWCKYLSMTAWSALVAEPIPLSA
jgi:hypothetical protein